MASVYSVQKAGLSKTASADSVRASADHVLARPFSAPLALPIGTFHLQTTAVQLAPEAVSTEKSQASVCLAKSPAIIAQNGQASAMSARAVWR